jgi:hypothetical protein
MPLSHRCVYFWNSRSTPRVHDSAAFSKTFGPSGHNALNMAEMGAVTNEYNVYEQQYKDWQNAQKK